MFCLLLKMDLLKSAKLYTVIFPFNQPKDKVLLGLKKHGMGVGLWNGFGGKLEEGETMDECALRELQEESGIRPDVLEHRGVLYMDNMTIFVYVAEGFNQGQVRETEEMKPEWFLVDQLPSDRYSSAKVWWPLLFKGEKFVVRFTGEEYEIEMADQKKLSQLRLLAEPINEHREVKAKPYTLVFPFNGTQVLLGMKKRGFGVGKLNGFGGKVEKGESFVEGARRELTEECGLRATEMEECGVLWFYFDDKPGEAMEVHVFRTAKYEGAVTESDEMRPFWFHQDQMPFDRMWADDQRWWPLLLNRQWFVGRFWFQSDQKTIDREQIKCIAGNF